MERTEWKEWDDSQRELRLAEQSLFRQSLEKKERQLARLRKLVVRLRRRLAAVHAANTRKDRNLPSLDLSSTIGG